MKQTLYIMAKAPVMGRAKTRLAADIGVTHAKRHYRAMMSKIIRNVHDPRWDVVLAVTPPSALGHVPEWDGMDQVAQVSGSLSPRLAQVFARKGPTLVIGTDSPQITARDIAEGFMALKQHEVVFGPASDGGFWLMGANGPVQPARFDGVRWSTEHTLLDMADQFDDVGVLRTLTDIDDAAALKAYQQRN